MLKYFLIGAALGAATGVPIGPVNVAVIHASFRHTLRRALAVGFGGAVADGLYAAAGILGVGPWLNANPSVTAILQTFSGVALIGYGFVTARSRPSPAAASNEPEVVRSARSEIWSGFTVGLLLIVLNPAAIVTWVVLVGAHMQTDTRLEGLAAVLGIFTGSFSWFTGVAWVSHHGKHVMGDKAVWIPRVVGVLLVGYGLYLLSRAFGYWFV